MVVFRLQRSQTKTGSPLVLLTTNTLIWRPSFDELLQTTFQLTAAETEIARSLVESGSVNEIAAARQRSVGTIRVQIKSILAKTETRSQVELVRLVLTMIEMIGSQQDKLIAGTSPHAWQNSAREFALKTLQTADGRRLDYAVMGHPEGRPILYLSQAYGFIRWPASAEVEVHRLKWRVIIPIRAGYGASDPFPKGADCDAIVVQDCLDILAAEKVIKCPVLSFGDDSYFAIKLANGAPQIITAIIACAGVLPLTRKEQFERMDKWHRFIMAGAKYTPHLLPFFVKAGFLLAQKIGRREFVHSVFAKSPADLETFERPEVFEAMMTGSKVVLSEKSMAHDTFARCLTGGFLRDWKADVQRLEGRLPILFFNGDQDPQVPKKTLQEFSDDYSWIDFTLLEDTGQLVFFRHWQTMMTQISKFLP